MVTDGTGISPNRLELKAQVTTETAGPGMQPEGVPGFSIQAGGIVLPDDSHVIDQNEANHKHKAGCQNPYQHLYQAEPSTLT